MLLKWRQRHFVRFLPLIGNPFLVPVGLQQLLKQLSVRSPKQRFLVLTMLRWTRLPEIFLASDSHYHHSLSRGKKAVQPSDSSTSRKRLKTVCSYVMWWPQTTARRSFTPCLLQVEKRMRQQKPMMCWNLWWPRTKMPKPKALRRKFLAFKRIITRLAD